LPGGDLVAVFFCDPDELAGQQQGIDQWLAALDSTTFTRLRVKESGYVPVDSPRTAGAGCSIAEMISGNGWVACGDAAAAYDPVSSHGIATAIASGQDAAEAVFFSLQGDSEPLARYDDRVRRSYFHCMRLRREVYSQERRWPDSQFWNRRSEQLDIPESSC
jgi:2-polyprenyl-6-methoxyphenol hydroxylase-like FAD-dependent oxidoreductase